ncbi:DNA topoisomerase [Durusdinium trenchii]|uniref:DNA topoisomerase n=1 Tax=Durusdinium trenchii TaxID=1381693 RepID=A0ABP0IE38_9DINO
MYTLIAIRLEAIAIRLEAIASRLEAIASRLEAIATRLEAISISFFTSKHTHSYPLTYFNPFTLALRQLHDAARNVAFIAGIAATIAGSWIFTGKWWKVPLGLALPSMIYRLWTTRGSTEKLAQVSASVDSKYIASTEEAQKELHMFMCSGCGYTLFPARGREGAFFNEKFKCPMCGASKESGHRVAGF